MAFQNNRGYGKGTYNATIEYLNKYGDAIARSIADTGIYFPAIVAQSALESGWGKSGLTAQANNFGGIKYNPNLPGVVGKVTKMTNEFVKGKKVSVAQDFSRFATPEDGFRAHVQVLLKERYKDALKNSSSPEDQILRIARSGYTTTPPQTYLDHLKGIINSTRDVTGIGRIVAGDMTNVSESIKNRV